MTEELGPFCDLHRDKPYRGVDAVEDRVEGEAMPAAVVPAPVEVGDRVCTPAGTAGTVRRVWWVPPGPSALAPHRWRPGHWLAVVWETEGVEEPGEQSFDAASLTPLP